MTKKEVLQVITDNITDNNSGAITAEVMRDTLNTMVEYTPEGTAIPVFEGILEDSITITDATVLDDTGGVVIYSSYHKKFVLSLDRAYYSSWGNVVAYMDSTTGLPITNRLFEYNKQQYVFNGTDLVPLLIGIGYTYIGTATPLTTPMDITAEDKVFYIAVEEGDYTGFGQLGITELTILKSEEGRWTKEGLGISLDIDEKLTELEQEQKSINFDRIKDMMRSEEIYKSLILQNPVDITPDESSYTDGKVLLDGTIVNLSALHYTDIVIERGYVYNINGWSVGTRDWSGVTLYDSNNELVYSAVQYGSSHYIFPLKAVKLRICKFKGDKYITTITKQFIESPKEYFADINYSNGVDKLDDTIVDLLSDTANVYIPNQTSGYYDFDGIFHEDSSNSWVSTEYSIKRGCVYLIDCRPFYDKPTLIAVDANDSVLFTVGTRIEGKLYRFSDNVSKIKLCTYSGWGIGLQEHYSYTDLKGKLKSVLKLHTGNNVFDNINSRREHVLKGEGFVYDPNANNYIAGEIYNLYGETQMCVTPLNYTNCKYTSFDKYGNVIAYGAKISSSAPIDISGAYKIHIQAYVHTGNLMVNFGSTALPYEDYYEYYDIPVKIKEDKPLNSILGGQKKSIIENSLTNDRLILTTYPKYLKKSNTCIVEAMLTTWTQGSSYIYIGLYGDVRGNKIKIDDTKIYFQDANGKTYTSVEHNLNISTYIKVLYKVSLGRLDYIVSTLNGVYNGHYDSNDIYRESYGQPFVEVDSTTELSDVVVSGSSEDFKRPVWVIGDSMVSIFSGVRWPYHVLETFGYQNWLLQGLAGGTSLQLYNDLLLSLEYGCPKYLLWLLGANDNDANYQNQLDIVLSKCNELNIIPILLKFPDFYGISSADKKTSAVKNAYMLSKNKRYIDFRKAVSSNTTATIDGVTVNVWYGDDLSLNDPPEGSYIGGDRIHPSISGAKAEAAQVIVDFPEIVQY